jgi:hypothetical protein
MSYTIYNTDGTILLTLGDGKIDQLTTSLTLIGKNVNSYGEYFNNNLIRLLENFASEQEPVSPVTGQLWYDTSTGRLRIYDLSSQFRPITNTLVAETQPSGLASQDFWFDSTNDQLFFSTDGQTLFLIGPQNSSEYGKTGWIVDTPTDASDVVRAITTLYSNDQVVGAISSSDFTLSATSSTAIGLTSVATGFNLNPNIANFKFVGTATSADTISGVDINHLLRNDINQTTTGSFVVQNNLGLTVANNTYDSISLYADPGTHAGTLAYNSTNADFRIQITNSDTGLTNVVYVDSILKQVGIWNDSPSYPLDIIGDTRISGDLLVTGTTTNLNTVNLQVNDTNIELGYGHNTDTEANGGGITLHGSSNHTIRWLNDNTGWNINDNLNLSSGNEIKIGGFQALTINQLGPYVTDAPGLVRLGTLDYLTVNDVSISGTTIETVGPDQNLNLAASGTGTISVSNIKITDLATPEQDNDAATKAYVDSTVFAGANAKAFALTLDVTNHPGALNDYVQGFLDLMFPITNAPEYSYLDIPDGARAKVLCGTTSILKPATTSTVRTSAVYALTSATLVTVGTSTTLLTTTATVASGLTGAASVTVPVQTLTPTTSYIVQTWLVQIGTWTNITV